MATNVNKTNRMKWIGSSSLCRSYETTELHNYCVRDEMQNRKSTCAMAKEPKNALILERFRWDKIRQRLKTSHDVRDAVETVQPDDNFDKQLREYLLNKRSKNSNGKKCVDDRRINIDKDKGQLKLQATELEEIRKRDEDFRRAQIERAEQLLKIEQPGPRQLRNALKLSDILREQQQQRDARLEQRRQSHEAAAKDDERFLVQTQHFIDEQRHQIALRRQRNEIYRENVGKDIEDRRRERLHRAHVSVEMAKFENESNEQQCRESSEKERKKLREQRERFIDQMEKTTLAAFADRKRMSNRNEREQRAIDNYWQQKREEEMRRRREQIQKRLQQTERRNRLARQLIVNQQYRDAERPSQLSTVATKSNVMEKQHAREQRLHKLRNERINYHAQEREKFRQTKQRELINRLGEKFECNANAKLDFLFDCARRAKLASETKRLKEIIRQQIDDQQKAKANEKEKNIADTNEIIERQDREEDAVFLCLANKVMNVAEKRGNPLFPITKIVSEYKSTNRLLPPKDYLPHLKTKIDVKQFAN